MRSFIVMAYFTIVGISAINFIAAQVSAVKFTVSVPEFSSQMNDRVYLTGSFNGWRPNDSLYIMNRENKTIYSLLVPLFDGKRY